MLSLTYPLFLLVSFDFDFFLHVYFFAMLVVEDILQKCEFLVRNDLDAQSVFHLPLAFQRHNALVDIGSDVGMDVE